MNDLAEDTDISIWQWTLDTMWRQKYGDISREDMSRMVCKQKAIKNDPQIYESYLKDTVIELGDNYEIYCRGKINDKYEVFQVRIHGAVSNNLSGPHLVSIEGGESFWVHSLTALRKKFLKFEDFVSFERSSFITYECDTLRPIRVKMIRQHIQIPFSDPPEYIYNQPDKYYFYSPQDIKEISTELTQRSVCQINRMLFQIKQIYHRDNVQLPNSLHFN